MNFKVLISAILASTIAVVGCDSGSSGTAGSGGEGGGGGSAASGGNGGGGEGGSGWVPIADCEALPAETGLYSIEDAPATSSDDCTEGLTLSPSGGDDAAALNTLLEGGTVQSGDVICLSAGEYDMGGTVFVTLQTNLTIKGIGPTPNDVKLDWALRGDRGFDVTATGFHIENMWLFDTKGNGVEVKAKNTPENPNVFRKLFVSWAAGAVTENGRYSIYPTGCENAIVEYNEVVGASDAGIYIGQCIGGIVRYNKVHQNVAGLEVENCANIEVYNNEAYDNTAGLFIAQEPGLDRLKSENILYRDNISYCNNRPNFAEANLVVSGLPAGSGGIIYAGTNIEMRNNIYDSNSSTAVGIASNVFFCQVTGFDCSYGDDPLYDPYPSKIYLHDNLLINNGFDPQEILGDLNDILQQDPLQSALWDGYIAEGVEDPEICLGEAERASYLDLTSNQCADIDTSTGAGEVEYATCLALNNSTDATDRNCALDPITP